MSTFKELFHEHYHTHIGKKGRKPTCHWCQLKSFSSWTSAPVAIVNEIDTSVLSSTFRFIERPILRQGVEPAEASFRTGCECIDDRHCQQAGCHCLEDMTQDSEDWSGRNGKIYLYHSTGDRKGLMKGAVLQTREPVYECHSGCACSEECGNRVVERGRRVGLEVFKTRNRGWGVKSTEDVKKGQYLDNYVGEIITSSEADRRRQASDVAQRKDVYLFALDKFSDPDSIDERLAGPPLEVDGEFYSGPTRFINHSCDPNLRIFARVGDHADKHIHDLAFFGIRDIDAGEELTFDYVDGENTNLEEDSRDPSKKKDMTVCLCGSENCRKFLW